ncbi:uncharacterized protein Triagg1_9823 [Trichoderma aggressivum f. europaeum]|uniref:Uncharacterized protein n=1 Tax=Trichoderma aggressivum f. europaeum TaxID=173218 RepID=A0AAE1LWV6_9HYPO|nr:hypothetical protein Triagg1_9823 [Trichoderma aggressivum f. europaeum]
MEPQEPILPSPHVSTTHAQMVAQFEAAKGRLLEIISMREKTPAAISASTESRANALLGRWEAVPPIVDPSLAFRWAGEINERLIEMNERLTDEAKYSSAFVRLEDLKIMVFQLRYSDYMPSYKNDLYNQAKGSPIRITPTHAGPLGSGEAEKEALTFFENKEWTAIHDRLVNEHGPVTTTEFPKYPWASQAPLVRLIQVLAARTETEPLDIYDSIRICSEGRHSYAVYNLWSPFDINGQPITIH